MGISLQRAISNRCWVFPSQFFIEKASSVQNTTLSGYVTDADGPQDCIKIHNGHVTIKDSLRSVIEEADARIIPHIEASIEEGLERFVVLSE